MHDNRPRRDDPLMVYEKSSSLYTKEQKAFNHSIKTVLDKLRVR